MADVTLDDGTVLRWHAEDDRPPPETVVPADDTTRARDALRQLRAGSDLLWTGDWHNGRQLLGALRRRVKRPRSDGQTLDLAERWRRERAHTRDVARVLGRVLVQVQADGSVDLRRAPDTRQALTWALGEPAGPSLVALGTVIGALGAAGWRHKGVPVPGLEGRIHPHFGVFAPTRHAYVGLLEHLDWQDRRVLDTGCGTGVLGLVALQRGADQVWAVDIEPRAVACARDNAQRLGLDERYHAMQADLFWPDQRVHVAVFNPPWLPETPRTRLDRAVFDPGDLTRRWLHGLPQHLLPGGVGALLVSDLGVRLGLRDERELPDWIAQSGLTVQARHQAPATHKRARDPKDPLHRARAAEQVQLWVVRTNQ